MTRRWLAALCASVVLGAVVVPAVSAGAGVPVCQVLGPGKPDGRIKVDGQPFVGDGTYGAGQLADTAALPGEKVNLFVRYRNTSGQVRDVRVDIFATADESFAYKVFKGETEVTDRTLSGPGIKFSGIAPNASTAPLRIQVRVKASAIPDAFGEAVARGVRNGVDVGCGDRIVGGVTVQHT